MSIMPCFGVKQAFAEGIIVGRILAGYGELELEMCVCLDAIKGDFDASLRLVFSKRGAEKRIEIADTEMDQEVTKAGLRPLLTETLADMDWCREIRNQYAHCHWYWTEQGLCFVNLEALAKRPTPIKSPTVGRLSLSLSLLQQQVDYLFYVKECFWNLQHELLKWAGKPSSHSFARPSKILRPILHN